MSDIKDKIERLETQLATSRIQMMDVREVFQAVEVLLGSEDNWVTEFGLSIKKAADIVTESFLIDPCDSDMKKCRDNLFLKEFGLTVEVTELEEDLKRLRQQAA